MKKNQLKPLPKYLVTYPLKLVTKLVKSGNALATIASIKNKNLLVIAVINLNKILKNIFN